MASTGLSGPRGSNRWHMSPTMYATGTLSANRNGSTISGYIQVTNKLYSGSKYGYPVYVKLLRNGSEIQSWTSASGGNWSMYQEFSFSTNDGVTLQVMFVCGQSGGCTKGYGETVLDGSIWIDSYNPATPATNVSHGTVYTTNHSSSSGYPQWVDEKPDLEAWFDWWGQSSGNLNPIDQYAVDITVNDENSNNARSYWATSNYTQNTHVNLFNMCQNYGARVRRRI